MNYNKSYHIINKLVQIDSTMNGIYISCFSTTNQILNQQCQIESGYKLKMQIIFKKSQIIQHDLTKMSNITTQTKKKLLIVLN